MSTTLQFSNFAYVRWAGSNETVYYVTSGVTVTYSGDTLEVGDKVTVTYTNGSSTLTRTMTYAGQASDGSMLLTYNGNTFYATDSSIESGDTLTDIDKQSAYLCFAAGTLILAEAGEIAVEDLKPGMLVRTADGGLSRVTWIGRQTLAKAFHAEEHFCPVRIAAGAIAPGQPTADLTVTPDHGIVFAEAIVHAAALVNGTSITRTPKAELPALVTYYHVETEDHAVLLANGCPAESFVDNASRARFDNYAEFLALSGDAVPALQPLDLPRATGPRQVPAAIRARLSARAAQLATSSAA